MAIFGALANEDNSTGFRFAVETLLAIRVPASVFWGEKLWLFYNAPYGKLIGKRHPAAYGRPVADSEPENWEELEPLVRGVRESGKAILLEDFYVERERANGLEEHYYTFSLSPIVDERGERGVLCIAADTTASVLNMRAANERIAELGEFKKLADNVTDIVYMHGSDGTIAWANERWYSFTGLSREASLSLEVWAQIMPQRDLAAYVATLERALPARQAYEIEVSLKSASASESKFRLHFIRATPMFDDEGFLLRWAASATDIHDRRNAELEARKQLERDRDREHQASLAFQNAAMPKTLPSVPGLTFSAVYEPAEAESLVGGDWYDAFLLSDGRIVLSVGDVMGSGLTAAVTMAAVRQAIRGAAQIYPDPASVLDAADRALRAEQPDRIVTAFVAVLDPLVLGLTFASAGQPAPMLRLPSGDIVELLAPDLPLGLRSELQRGNVPRAEMTIAAHSVLVMYTDGLTEATKDIAAGEQRLRGAIARANTLPAADLARHIRDTVLTSSNDDVAILTVTFEAPPSSVPQARDLRTRWSFPIVDASAALSVRREVAAVLTRLGATVEEAADAKIVIGELLGNVMRHATGDVQVMLDLSGDAPVLHILDDGDGFTFHARLPRDEMSESGRGLYIAAQLTRDLSVVPRPEGGSHARAVFRIRAFPR